MTAEPTARRAFLWALFANFIWINASEIARYFFVIRPMLRQLLAGQEGVAPMSWSIFGLWGIWDAILIVAATGFYWLWLDKFGKGWPQIVMASAAFTVTLFGLLWLGVANMGLAPYSLLLAALPLAWLEQAGACWIVFQVRAKSYSPSSMRSI